MDQWGQALSELLRQRTEQLERAMREEVARSATGTRQEMGGTLAQFQQTLLMQQGDHARTQNEQLKLLSDANERRLTEVRGHGRDTAAGLAGRQ